MGKKSEKKWQNKNKYKSKIPIKEEMRGQEELKYTCWTEISSIAKSGTVLPGGGAAAYKLRYLS